MALGRPRLTPTPTVTPEGFSQLSNSKDNNTSELHIYAFSILTTSKITFFRGILPTVMVNMTQIAICDVKLKYQSWLNRLINCGINACNQTLEAQAIIIEEYSQIIIVTFCQ